MMNKGFQILCRALGIPYEITTYTSDVRGAGTEADVYVVLYSKDVCTSQKSLCPNKNDRKKRFNRGEVARFVVEVIICSVCYTLL